MAGKVLVLGASGGFGGACATAFAAAGWQVSRYVRGSDMTAAATGMDVIVNGLNPPGYHDWARLIPAITDAVLAAAQASGATVLVPGNVYPFGVQPGPWGPDTPQVPVSRKGQIRATMEARYRAATKAGYARVIILRGGDFIGEEAPNTVMAKVVLKDVAKGRVATLGDPSVQRAYAYLPDMARAAVGLAEMRQELPAFAEVPFAGFTFGTDELAAIVAQVTGKPVKITRFPWWLMRMLSPVWELARELTEMRYLFETPHRLDGAVMARLLPGFVATPLDEVIARHLRAVR
ncbi:MAG: epimerase [Paracoccaceae bacterium]